MGGSLLTIDEFITQIKDKSPPAPEAALREFESRIGCAFPDDYRYFLINCNGGYLGGRLWFIGSNSAGKNIEAGVHHIGGFRAEDYFSLDWARECYLGRIPSSLVWIYDDPFGNAICLGVTGPQRGRVYFWDHENEPDSEFWDGSIETAGNIELICDSFVDYVAGLRMLADTEE